MTTLLADICVNGNRIPAAAIAAEAQNHPAPGGKPGLAWRAAQRALTLRLLLLQEAQARGIAAEPCELSPGLFETPEDAAIRAVLEQSVIPQPVADEDLARAYADAPERFLSPPLWEASHILFAAAPADDAARRAARRAAEAAHAHVLADPAAWNRLAEASDCPSRAHGGRLGQIGPGDVAAGFERALASLRPGEVSAPVETRFGFHLIRLEAAAERAVLPFAAVAPGLRLAAEKAAWARASRSYAESLLARARIEGPPADAA
jgi:peptidyl-prolyl cis-trans isomerase C